MNVNEHGDLRILGEERWNDGWTKGAGTLAYGGFILNDWEDFWCLRPAETDISDVQRWFESRGAVGFDLCCHSAHGQTVECFEFHDRSLQDICHEIDLFWEAHQWK